MTAERWREVEEAFHGALDQPEELRAAWLETACGDDTGLLAEVRALLQANLNTELAFEREIRRTAAMLLLSFGMTRPA
ncbi:MAG: hypothetical protein JNK87_30565 [Bryobacterales bacterium]|nr:hypothetical protein [Bryobacterales bacterium]